MAKKRELEEGEESTKVRRAHVDLPFITVSSFELVDDEFFVYVIDYCFREGDELRRAEVRYSDLEKWHKVLSKKHPNVLKKAFPPKRLFKTDIEVAKERQSALDAVFKEVVKEIDNDEIREYLEPRSEVLSDVDYMHSVSMKGTPKGTPKKSPRKTPTKAETPKKTPVKAATPKKSPAKAETPAKSKATTPVKKTPVKEVTPKKTPQKSLPAKEDTPRKIMTRARAGENVLDGVKRKAVLREVRNRPKLRPVKPTKPKTRSDTPKKSPAKPLVKEATPKKTKTETPKKSPAKPTPKKGTPSRSKKEMSRDIALSVRDREIKQQLEKGTLLIKHGRRGKPHERVIKLVNDKIVWLDPKKTPTKPRESIKLSEIKQVTAGRATDVLKRSAKSTDDAYVFSLHDGKRTLDLQVMNRDERQNWVDYFSKQLSK